MRSSTLVAAVCFAPWQVHAYEDMRLMERTTIPAPISVAPSQNMDGDDGPWSSFTIQVGTPPQDLRVLISTASAETWVVLPPPVGCPADVPSCPSTRGAAFYSNASSTWQYRGIYGVDSEANLNLDSSAIYGNDTITLGVQGSDGPTLQNQIVSEIGTQNFWLGSFGVNPKPTNFSTTSTEDLNNGQSSYLSNLKEQNLIPSLSFGYTAGAPYRLKGVLGSLTLGGYDSARYIPNDISFNFAPDNSRDLVVGIQSITSTEQDGTEKDLLPSGGINAYIDSTVPYIYLPIDACQAFESAFGLTYDNTSELYLVSGSLHQKLKAQNASVTFTLGNTATSGRTTNITLPYDSFDLTATWPLVQNGSLYFPLKRADNQTQYTLGRTFLQEAYLTVDWERQNFTVSQCLFNDSINQNNIVAIQSEEAASNSNSTSLPPATTKSSSNGKTIGIAVGVVAVVLILIGGVAGFLIYNKRKKSKATKEAERAAAASDEIKAEQVQFGYGKHELDTDTDHARFELDENGQPKPGFGSQSHLQALEESKRSELASEGANRAELGSHNAVPRFEMYDPSSTPVELPTDYPRELEGSSASGPSSTMSSPIIRSINRSPVNRSTDPSALNNNRALPPSPLQRAMRPGLQDRSPTMDSLPSQPSHLPSPVQGPVRTMSPVAGNETLSPVSPEASGTMRHSGLMDLMRGMGGGGAAHNAYESGRRREGDRGIDE